MTTAAQGDPPPSVLLGPLLGSLPTLLLQQEVLRRLGPTDLASLARAGRGCAAAVAATALMKWAKHEKFLAVSRDHFPLSLKKACFKAAAAGNLEVLEWLREHGCPWDVHTCSIAAYKGRLAALRWLREHGCPWAGAYTRPLFTST